MMRKLRTVSLFSFAVLVIGAVGAWYATDAVNTPRQRYSIDLAIAKEALSALSWIAYENGYYEEEGVYAAVSTFPSGKRGLKESFSVGKSDVLATADVTITLHSFQTDDFVILGTVGTADNGPRIVARKDHGITRSSDLAGKRIATQKGSAVHFFLHNFLTKHGLTTDDVQLSFKKAEKFVQELIDGEIDAFSMREPYVSMAKSALGDNVIVLSEPGIYQKMYNLIIKRNLLEDSPGLADALLRALLKAERFAEDHPLEAQKLVADFLEIDLETMKKVWATQILRVSLDQSLLLGLEDQARWAIQNGLTDRTAVPNYLDLIHLDALRNVKPSLVTVLD